MKEITQQVLSDIESIKLSLEALSNKGIPIIDTFAPITTFVNIVTTVFATAFGGWVTIQLFKRQEKMRIKEDLRLSFYKEYREKYKDLYESILDLNESIKRYKKVWNEDSMYIKDAIIGAYGLKNWNCYYPQDINTDYINKIKEINVKSQILNKFLKINNNIFTLNTIYDDTNNKIEEIKSVYIELGSAYMVTKGMDDELRKNLNNINEYKEKLNQETISIKFDEKMTIKHLIQVEKSNEDFKEKQVKRHNELIPRVLDFDIELDKILEDIQSMNEAIENEYISKYFKKTIFEKNKNNNK